MVRQAHHSPRVEEAWAAPVLTNFTAVSTFHVDPLQAWTAQLTEPPMVTEDGIDTSEWPQKNLIVAISSDRGLCGGENRLHCARLYRQA